MLSPASAAGSAVSAAERSHWTVVAVVTASASPHDTSVQNVYLTVLPLQESNLKAEQSFNSAAKKHTTQGSTQHLDLSVG